MGLKTKPIFIAKKYLNSNDEMNNSLESIKHIQKSLQLQLSDYHVLFIPIIDPLAGGGVEFECFYPEKLEEKDWEDFKTEVKNQIKQNLKK